MSKLISADLFVCLWVVDVDLNVSICMFLVDVGGDWWLLLHVCWSECMFADWCVCAFMDSGTNLRVVLCVCLIAHMWTGMQMCDSALTHLGGLAPTLSNIYFHFGSLLNFVVVFGKLHFLIQSLKDLSI